MKTKCSTKTKCDNPKYQVTDKSKRVKGADGKFTNYTVPQWRCKNCKGMVYSM